MTAAPWIADECSARPSGLRAVTGSFRDPRGQVFVRENRVFRRLSPVGTQEWRVVASSRLFARGQSDGNLVNTRELSRDEAQEAELSSVEPEACWLEHERLPWISYPYEWSFGMLRDAALLQLDLLIEGLAENLVLRDGTPYNVQFVGFRPVLMDLLSLGPFEPQALWPGYRQFCETQLFPLFLASYRGVDFRPWLRGSLSGLRAGECRRLLGWSAWWRKGAFSHVVLQDWLSRGPAPVAPAAASDGARVRPVDTRSVVARNARGLRGLVAGLKPPHADSVWTDYESSRHHYTAEDRDQKDRFIEAVFQTGERPLVWDIGCNTGRFSRLAARTAECVVALDSDPACVDRLYTALRRENNTRIIPLVVNLADTAGGLGWRGTERQSLYERQRPTTVLALAVLHHLVFGEGIPLDQVVDWLTGLAGELVVEFVGADDPMVRALRSRRSLHHPGYNEANFLTLLGRTHQVMRQESLCGGNRLLVHALARHGRSA